MSRYIYEDALKEVIRRMWENRKITNTKYNTFLEILDYVPTADVVEVVHGKWIPRTNLPKQEIFICSVCGGWAYSPWIGSRKKTKPNWCKYKYCPNCGADMEVEE